MDLTEEVRALALRARQASACLAVTSHEARQGALAAMAEGLRCNMAAILEANAQDVAAAREAGVSEPLVDRLQLDEGRLESMAQALEDLIGLPDPLGQVQQRRTLYNGIELERVSVPLGVVAVVFEARPNVCADAAGICVKSGNACVLRGGSLAARSNEAICDVLAQAVEGAGLPAGTICAITSTERAATDALMSLHGVVDVLIPRGGAGLIRHCAENSKVPVIETGTGNCHVYVHSSADLDQALRILLDAKCRRFGVCNAAETLLVDQAIAETFLARALPALAGKGVVAHGDELALACARAAEMPEGAVVLATEEDWATEYLGPEIAVHCVADVDEAIDHVNRYGTRHSEAIVAADEEAIQAFLARVDAAAVYANASTAFTDGGQFGLGAEIGISTQKLHARGPFAAEALVSYKYLLRGSGQVRG